jgi:hypothetical protein
MTATSSSRPRACRCHGARAWFCIPQRHGAVPPSRAPDGYGQVTLPFPDVVRQQVENQVHQPDLEFLRLGILIHKALNDAVAPVLVLQAGHVIGVGKKAHIKNQIGVRGNAMTVSEGDHGNQKRPASFEAAEPDLNKFAQLVDVHARGINHCVRDLPHGLQEHALQTNSLAHGQVAAQRVRAASLLKTAHQDFV